MRYLALCWLVLAGLPQAMAAKLVTPGSLFNSDPTCRQIGERFYLFTTQDPFTVQFQRDNQYFKGMYAYHALSTTDFDHWVDHGSILTSRDVSWNVGGALWDGDAGIPGNGRYYAYAPFRVNPASEANYGRFHIGVFEAGNVAGPYRAVFNSPMTLDGQRPLEGLSPAVVQGDDGASYLLWGSGDTEKHEAWIARLKSNMTELDGKPRQLRVPLKDPCGNLEYYESPALLKMGARWILTYVAYKDAKGPGCDAKGSYVRYVSAASMFGPFDTKAPRTLIYPVPGGQESTQQGVCSYRGRSYLAYHVPYDDVMPYADHHRQVAVTALAILPDGSLQPIHPETDAGVGSPTLSELSLDAFAPRREVAEFTLRSGVTGEKGLAGEYQMKFKPGGYLVFRHMDFGSGPAAFRVEASAESPSVQAWLDVRLGSPAGALIASVPVQTTGGPTTYRILTAPVTGSARGNQDLVLVGRGTGGDANGHLFNVTWFGFDPAAAPLYLDPSQPFTQRAADLVSRMSLDEKVHQMQNAAPAIPRLGVPSYEYWNEALHGVARGGEATVFPQAIAMAASWDKNLLHAEGNTIGVEGRARFNEAQREGNHDRYFGLTFWAPNINILRDPRWGRGQETLGEDPYLTGVLATEFVRGIQGDDPHYLQAIATPKHFAVHSGPEPLRHGFDVHPSPRDLNETYLPAFRRTVVAGHAHSLMCAYNAIDGKPACADEELLEKILRGDWGFDGFVTSDCGAIDDITHGHHLTATNVEGAAAAVRAGTDTACAFKDEYLDLSAAVRQHLLPETQLDVSLTRLFTARMRLGMFDPPDQVPFSSIPPGENHSQAHRELALRAARESVVLLKNDGILPITAPTTRIAVIGPGATSLIALEGNYKGTPTAPVLPLDGMESEFGTARVTYAQGAPFVDQIALPVPRTVFGAGLQAQYFSGSNFQRLTYTRTDRQIDFDWNAAAPAPGVSPNAFSVRWTGSIQVPAAGDYSFEVADRRCDPSQDHETYLVRIEGTEAFQAGSTCEDFGQPRKSVTIHFADTRPHRFIFEYTHQSPRFSAGVTLSWKAPTQALTDEAVAAARSADVVVAFVGLVPWLEGEEMPVHIPGFDGGDRTALSLPESQIRLLAALADTQKPLVVVLETGSAVTLGPLADSARAILEGWYGGERGGQAIAEVLSGSVNPSGRLPMTFYASVDQLPAFADYAMKGRTYRYFAGRPQYPFGYGLSYSHFKYSDLKITRTPLTAGDAQEVTVAVHNTSDRAGAEVVQLYLSASLAGTPLRSLKGFERIDLGPGETQSVRFELSSRDLAFAGDDGRWRIEPADYRLWVGGGQPDSGAAGMTGHFRVTGHEVLSP